MYGNDSIPCNKTALTELSTLSLHDALPILLARDRPAELEHEARDLVRDRAHRSEEHTSELQSRLHLVCRLLLEKKIINSILPLLCSIYRSHQNRSICF